MKRPAIYDYLDYRSFLKDMFCFRKWKDNYFSYRYFAGKSGFSSPNYLKLVIDGDRNLTNNSIAKIAKGFKLKIQEREYFENLVFMNQAQDHEERDRYYRKMMSAKGFGHFQKLEKAKYEYCSKWYYPVIREILVLGNRRHTPSQVANLLKPNIKPKEAKKAIKLLTELGLIRKSTDGCWEQCDKIISTGPEVKSLAITNFHREVMQLAAESIDRFPAGQRDISAITISMKHNKISEVKKRIAVFREEMMELACSDSEDDQVLQINIQAFPVTSHTE
jgi:uncharacterized protein (TIGR02147 family)